MPKTKAREASFESSLVSLEQIVDQLETGDLPLERALELFEEGVRLARRCQDQLSEVEQRVELLLQERGEIKTAPLELPRDSDSRADTSATSAASASTSQSEPPPESQVEEEGEDIDESVPF